MSSPRPYRTDYILDDMAPGQSVDMDSRTRITVRNLRIREDTAKYLYNLNENSAHYDPKSRSMHGNPFEVSDIIIISVLLQKLFDSFRTCLEWKMNLQSFLAKILCVILAKWLKQMRHRSSHGQPVAAVLCLSCHVFSKVINSIFIFRN